MRKDLEDWLRGNERQASAMEPSAPERREETDSAAWGLLVAPLTGSPVFTETAAREQPEREDILLAARVPEREELFEREEPFLSEFSRAEPQEDAERAPEPEEAETGDLFAVPEVPKPEPEWPFPSDPVSASTEESLPFPGPRADEGGAEDSWKGEVGPEEDRSSPSAYPAETPREVDPFIDRLRRVEEARRALRHRRVKPRLRYGRLALLGFLALLIVGAGWTALSRLWSDPVRDPVPPREEEGPALSADRASPDVPQSDDLKNEDPDPDPDPETVEKTLRERQYEHSLRMGGVALELSRYDEASRHFADALNVRSDDAGAWTFFAEARAGLGDVSGAIQSLRRALERDPALESAKIRLSDLEKERTEAEKTKAAEGGNGKTGRKAPAGGKNSPSPGAKSAGAANKAKVPPIQRKNGAKAAAQGSRTAPAVDGKEPSPSREALFNSGVSLFREGKFSESFEDFQACLRSGGSETLPSVSLAADLCPGSFDLFGSVGPLWGGFDAGLFPPFVRSLAEAVRLNPADRDLYANLVLSGARSGIDRKRLQTLLEGVYSHAFAHR